MSFYLNYEDFDICTHDYLFDFLEMYNIIFDWKKLIDSAIKKQPDTICEDLIGGFHSNLKNKLKNLLAYFCDDMKKQLKLSQEFDFIINLEVEVLETQVIIVNTLEVN